MLFYAECRDSGYLLLYIGFIFVGAIAYADNLVLLVPSVSAMRQMFTICDTSAHGLHMYFNVNRTKCMLFHCRDIDNTVKLGG